VSQVTLEQKLADCFRLQCFNLVLMMLMVVLSFISVIKMRDIMRVAKLLIKISSLINHTITKGKSSIE